LMEYEGFGCVQNVAILDGQRHACRGFSLMQKPTAAWKNNIAALDSVFWEGY
jgi:hypothetical protein